MRQHCGNSPKVRQFFLVIVTNRKQVNDNVSPYASLSYQLTQRRRRAMRPAMYALIVTKKTTTKTTAPAGVALVCAG